MRNKKSFVLVAVVVLCVIASIAGCGGKKNDSKPTGSVDPSNTQTKSTGVVWSYENGKYVPSSTPPKCPDPLLASPVELSSVESILYPGQWRNPGGGSEFEYKAHGGFILPQTANNKIDVKMAMDGTLVDASRYIQTGEQQYLLDFFNECGVRVRYDHLLTLTPELQKIVDATPLLEDGTSITTDFPNGPKFKAGDLIATRIGFEYTVPKGEAFDFGVYDARQPNEASKDAAYTKLHASGLTVDNFGICWLNYLPTADSAKALSLPGGSASGKQSDYCK